MGGRYVLVCGGAMTPFLKPLPLVGDFVLFEGRDWLVEATLVHGVVISNKDGAERYVPLSQIEATEKGE